MPLSDAACRNAKPTDKPRKIFDGGGMYLYVKPNGSRLWRMDYRFEGKFKTLSFGGGLADARERRAEARKLLSQGVEPAGRRAAKPATVSDTFEEIAREWHAKQAKVLTPKHATAVLARLERGIFPAIGRRPITAIEAPEILAALRKVEQRRTLDVAKRLLQSVGAVFRFAIASGKAARDPAADLRDALEPSPKPKHMARIDAANLPTFLNSLRCYDGREQTRTAIEFTLHTAVRTNELRLARWAELNGNLWRIPSERMKMRREHLVPLTPQALDLLVRLRTLAGDSEWVVPGFKGQPMSQNTMIFALYRLGYRSRLTIHGFRGMFSTILNEKKRELGFDSDWIEMQLAHVEDNRVRGAYNAAEYLEDRRRMMLWWSDYLAWQADIGELIG